MPAVSIITPAYNAEPYLPQTIASVLGQTLSSFELLVVDDGSTDGTAELVRRFAAADSRIRLIRQPNAGSAAARNTALREAQGELMALLDSDDLWMPGYLEEQVALLRRHPDVDVVSVNAINLGSDVDGVPLKPSAATGLEYVSLRQLLEVEDSVCVMSVFRRRVFELTGGFDPGARNSEDYDLWVRAACAGCVIAFNPRPGCYYRRRPDSKSAHEEHMLAGLLRVYEKARQLCADRPEELAAVSRQVARFTRRQHIARAKSALMRRDFQGAARAFASLAGQEACLFDRVLSRVGRAAPRCVLWLYVAKSACLRLYRSVRRPLARSYA